MPQTDLLPTPEPCQDPAKPAWVPPRITTLTSEEILDSVGPAMTCSGLP